MHVNAPQPPLRQVPLHTWARRRRAVAAALLAAGGLTVSAGAAAPPASAATGAAMPTAPSTSALTSASSAVAVAPVPTSRLLLTGTDLRGFKGGGWATHRQDLGPKATLEPLASCTNAEATLSPSVTRSLAIADPVEGWLPEGPYVDQRVVRYQPGKGDDVMNLFRRVVKQCPTRTLPSGFRERWSVRVDTRGTSTDTLVIRREAINPHSPWAAYYVVVRNTDAVSVIKYFPGEVVSDEAGAKKLAALSGTRLRTAR